MSRSDCDGERVLADSLSRVGAAGRAQEDERLKVQTEEADVWNVKSITPRNIMNNSKVKCC